MLRAKGITKSYGQLEVLKGVDLEVKKGEVISIVGASGAGKSTLLHILGTLDNANSGTLEIENKDIPITLGPDISPSLWYKRAINYLVDLIALNVLQGPVISYVRVNQGLPWYLVLSISVLIFFSYFLLLEFLFGKTLGKLLTGTKVFAIGAVKPTLGQVFFRTLFRLIPLEFISFFKKRPVGWHDDLSTTIVSETRHYEKKKENFKHGFLANFRNEKIGFIFQFHNLLPEFTALENVCIPGYIHQQNGKEIKERATDIMTSLGLGTRLDHKPSEMSGGEQQRTAVARALINAPSIILADEPSGNLDSKNARELHELFFKLRKKFDQTFVIVTHNQELADMADRKLEIKDGVIIH